MPILKSAIKKTRVDAKRERVNKIIATKVRKIIKNFRQSPKKEGLKEVFSAIDRAAKKGVFHKGKADRLKARLARLIKTNKKK